jgi:N4-gp56 family major capsid protein
VTTINYSTTNFDKTLTALVLKTIAENLRRETRYMVPGAYIDGNIIPGTNLIRHIKYSDLSLASVAGGAAVTTYSADGTGVWLTEGTPPAEEALSITYDEYGVNQAGRMLAITDRALDYSPHNIAAIAAERLAFNMLASVDAIVAATLAATTATTTNGHAKAALTTSDYLTPDLVRLQVAGLKANYVPSFGGDYFAFVHPYAVYDLMGDTKWQDIGKYNDTMRPLTGEVGRIFGCRFIETTVGTWVDNAGGAGTNIPVYSTFFFGRETWAMGDFGSIKSYVVRPGGDHSDPVAQKMLLGWKGYIGAKVLSTQGTRYRRLVHAGSIAGAAPTP